MRGWNPNLNLSNALPSMLECRGGYERPTSFSLSKQSQRWAQIPASKHPGATGTSAASPAIAEESHFQPVYLRGTHGPKPLHRSPRDHPEVAPPIEHPLRTGSTA